MVAAKHLTKGELDLIPQSNWYMYTLECGHSVYSRVRLTLPNAANEHYIRCPKCKDKPTNWTTVIKMEGVLDEIVRNVLSGTSFILPRAILRTGPKGHYTSRNPFPYSTTHRDY